jgi:hypothetical protein
MLGKSSTQPLLVAILLFLKLNNSSYVFESRQYTHLHEDWSGKGMLCYEIGDKQQGAQFRSQ